MNRYRTMLGAKIHRAVVTHVDLEYEGSVTLPPELLQAADIKQYEAVHVWNITRGTRFETYAISGLPGSTDLAVNGAAAHHAGPGDVVIIASFVEVEESQVSCHRPKLIFVDKNNRQLPPRKELPGPLRKAS